MAEDYPCAMVKLADEPNRSWSVPRTAVEAYAQLIRDFPMAQDVWLADHDVVRLLQVRYDFTGAGRINLKVKSMNKYFTEIGPVRLGGNFLKHPELNVLGHYQIWRRIKQEPKAFYFASSKKNVGSVPGLDSEEPENGLQLDRMVLDSDVCCVFLLSIMKLCTSDDVAVQVAALRLPKPTVGKKRPAPKVMDTAENCEAPQARRKPGPKPKPKPPPCPKPCLGWNASKYNPLIRMSLVAFLDALPPESEMLIPEQFPIVGPKDFYAVYNKDCEPSFCIYCHNHDPSNCERDKRSYKHCTACMKASGRLRTHLYLKSKHEQHQQTQRDESEDEVKRGENHNHYTGTSLDYGFHVSEF